METLKITHTTRFLLGLTCIMWLVVSSCSSKTQSNTVQPSYSYLTFIDASPDASSVLLFLDQGQVNAQAMNYGNLIPYFNVNPGTRIGGCYSTSTSATLATDTISLTANVGYSLFLTNKAPKQNQLVLLTDSISKPNTGYCGLRFVNLSPDAPAVDLAVTGGNTLASNIAFKKHTAFLPVATGSYNLEIRRAGTSTILATMPNVSLNSGAIYTVWLQGFYSSTDASTKLGGQIMTNATY